MGLSRPAGTKRRLGPNYFEVGIPDFEFQKSVLPLTAGKQRRQYWCWAACIQMILNYHGLFITQEQIVHYVFGSQVNTPATNATILRALTGWRPDTRGRTSTILATSKDVNAQAIVEDLNLRWPLLVALRNRAYPQIGHTCVLTAAYYGLDRFGNPIINQVLLRDPAPGLFHWHYVNWTTLVSECYFAARIWVQRN